MLNRNSDAGKMEQIYNTVVNRTRIPKPLKGKNEKKKLINEMTISCSS